MERGYSAALTEAAMTNYHRLCSLDTNIYFCKSGGWEAQDHGASQSVWFLVRALFLAHRWLPALVSEGERGRGERGGGMREI